MKQAELIVNRKSNRGNAALEEILSACKELSIDITRVYEVRSDTDIKQAIERIDASRIVVIAGGDGTVSAAVDHLAGSNINVAIVPLGTTNNFARSLDLSFDIKPALSAIKKNKLIKADLGQLNGDYFSNVAGIGVSAAIAKNVTNRQKKRWKRFAYAVVGVKEIIRHKPFLVTVQDKDKELAVHFETHQLVIANGKYHAGREIAQDAAIDNKELVVMKLGGRSRISLLLALIDFYLGTRKKIRHTSYLIGKHIVITTDRQQLIELDGEVTAQTPADITIKPDSLLVYKG